nr:hypothetical protein [Tanacetum cinerariifolium]
MHDCNSKVKDKNKVDLAAKIVNIDRKFIGRKAVRGNPLATNAGDSTLDTTATGHANAHVYVGGEPLKSILETNRTKDGVSNVVREVPAANMGIENNIEEGISGIPGTSCTDSLKLQDYAGVSNTQPKDVTKNESSKAVGVSFASMFNSEFVSKDAPMLPKRINIRTLICEEQDSNHDTVLLKAAKERVMSRYANTLVGYFNIPLIITKWTPNISLKPGVVTKVPVWVKLYNVPVVAYSKDGLSLIATQIGKPIMLDDFTGSVCVDSWVRISFARALIEIDANLDLKKGVKMAIPVDEDDGSGYISEVIYVEYEWKPPHCLDCKIFGHNFEKCPNKVIVTDDNVDNSAQNNDGFT